MTENNKNLKKFLEGEPDIYTDEDLKVIYDREKYCEQQKYNCNLECL